MNVLFALHGPINSNSGNHVHDYAIRLAQLGLKCIIAVPSRETNVPKLNNIPYELLTFDQILSAPRLFTNGNQLDIVHAWTPREIVRQFCQQLKEQHQFNNLIIHLEDNEEHMCESFIQQDIKLLRRLSAAELDQLIPLPIFHPLRGQEFLQSADGITIIIERLNEFVPKSIPYITLWASSDDQLFCERSLNLELRHQLGIPDEHTVLVYTGNVHAANSREVRSLYLAVALLNREGFPTTMIRTGKDFVDFLGENESWYLPFVKKLGRVSREMVPEIMATADIFVQPGRPDRFNVYRFPSKVPEFFSIGRPVILPAANIGLHTRHLIDAFVLPIADGTHIADAVKTILNDRVLYKQLSKNALVFAQSQLNGQTLAKNLVNFYAAVLNKSSANIC